jgi:membrane-associated phospholipid phosphatase
VQIGALLCLAAALVAAGGLVLGRFVTGPGSTWVSNDIDGPARTFSMNHSSPGLIRVSRRVGSLGNAAITGPIALLVGGLWSLRTRTPRPILILGSAFAGAALLTVVVKYAVNRTPASGPIPSFAAGTFPSGHALFALSVYGGIAVLAVAAGEGAWRWPVAVVLALVPVAVGLARIYLLDHFVSDVAGSIVMGAAWLTAVVTLIGTRPTTEADGNSARRSA